MENKLKHLDLIQGVINRMAHNSFALKGWAVTLIAGVFVLSNRDAEQMYFLVVYIPILVFWGLDAYYLWQGRLFRSLYDKVRKLDDENIDFDMNTSLPEFNTPKNKYWDCVLSVTEFWFYFPLAILSAGIIVITHC